ncbi:transposase [Streptomyces sp. SID3343]|uniref:transposase n=1 Tax=Streptomyces sp. SID3343 TaxID=2690260 RepID=UPI00137135B4|nr:transposase [Streptomyces sp. SID3343]
MKPGPVQALPLGIDDLRRCLAVIVDCLGLLLSVLVTPADVADCTAAHAMLARLRAAHRKIRLVWADGAYTGALIDWAAETLRIALTVVKRSDRAAGFTVLPRRWVVERTLGRLMRSRRPGPRLRNPADQQRSDRPLVDDHAHDPPSGPPRRRDLSPSRGVNTPGTCSAGHPRATRRFAFDRTPSNFPGTMSSPSPSPSPSARSFTRDPAGPAWSTRTTIRR